MGTVCAYLRLAWRVNAYRLADAVLTPNDCQDGLQVNSAAVQAERS